MDLYVLALSGLVGAGVPLRGVLLYTLARPSSQPEAAELGPVSTDWLNGLAERLRLLGLAVEVASSGD